MSDHPAAQHDTDPAPAPLPSEPLSVGIDVSHHNGRIDWPRAASSGLRFSVAKVTQGDSFKDPRGWENMVGARLAGLRSGAYHFLDMDSTPERQAHAFVEAIRTNGGAMAVDILALDLEDESSARLWGDGAGPAALAWLQLVEAATGIAPWVYVSPAFAERTHLDDVPELGRFPLWVAMWTTRDAPVVPAPWREWVAWQHSHKGRVPGIGGAVDLNRARLVL